MSLLINEISKKFADRYVLNKVTLEITQGEFVCLLGPSGCGKSTLLNIIAGLDQPTEGEIILNNQRIQKPGPDRTMMFQEAALFPWLNVLDNVKFGMKISGISKEEQNEKALYYLKMVNLSQFKHYKIHQLSGGMKQRVALARALTFDSKILLMDEPFAALDKQTKNILSDELQSIWAQTHKTIIFVTHSVEEALLYADRIVMMSSETGNIKKVFDVSTIERPRKRDDERFIHIRSGILNELKYEVKKVAEKEHDATWHYE